MGRQMQISRPLFFPKSAKRKGKDLRYGNKLLARVRIVIRPGASV